MPGLRRAASLFLFAWPGRGTAVIDELAAGASVGRDSLIVTETLADNLKKRDQSFFGSGSERDGIIFKERRCSRLFHHRLNGAIFFDVAAFLRRGDLRLHIGSQCLGVLNDMGSEGRTLGLIPDQCQVQVCFFND